jgi:hypothetical protein
MTVAIVEDAVPVLAAARLLPERFQTMIRQRTASGLFAWIDDASSGPMASFARGLRDDQRAVAAPLSLPWSNGQTEGHITKLKLVKCQKMYGRAKLDFLRARLTGAARWPDSCTECESEPKLHVEKHLGCLKKLRGGVLAITAFDSFDVMVANGTSSIASIIS